MHFWASVLTAFLISLSGCWFITRSTILRNLSNVNPTQDRWHKQATPGLGGIPIFLALACVVILLQEPSVLTSAILISAVLLMVFGAYDDLKVLSPIVKLLVQFCAAILFLVLISFYSSNSSEALVSLLYPSDLLLSESSVYYLYWVACVFWIIAIINAVNLLDNMDGLSGGVSFIACLAVAVIASKSPELMHLSVFYFSLSASLAGFLLLNVNPAKLFMGDAGALWIGLAVGIGTLIVAPQLTLDSKLPITLTYSYRWLIPFIICTVPISDTLMVIITRKLRGQPASVGGSDHLSHRLVCLGLNQQVAVAVLWLVAILAALLAITIHSQPLDVWLIPLCFYAVSVVFGVILLTRITSAPNGVATRKSQLS